jgi:hypothetical protein
MQIRGCAAQAVCSACNSLHALQTQVSQQACVYICCHHIGQLLFSGRIHIMMLRSPPSMHTVGHEYASANMLYVPDNLALPPS